LIVVHADDLKRGLVVEAIFPVAVHEPADDVIGVRSEAEDGVDGRDPEPLAPGRTRLVGL
jgi:hypothetical protein